MSGPQDNFLARWSRRKREVGEEDNPPSPLPGRVGEERELQPQHPFPSPTPASSPQGGGEQPQATEGSEPLPNLDELTAESDLSAFLRAGVPEALKKEALRRMWSLDPAIRDHVGLSEYAWDFNNPGSMAGFGAIAAGTPMAQLAASVISGQGNRSIASELPPEAPGKHAAPAGPPSGTVSPHLPTAVKPDAGDWGSDELSGTPLAGGPDPDASDTAAAPHARAAPARDGADRERAAPRHGGAMPRSSA